MPFHRNESDLASDIRMHRLNSAYKNGTRREHARPSQFNRGPRATMTPKVIANKNRVKNAFNFEHPARDTELGAYKEVGMIRGRVKSSYNLMTGKGVKSVKQMVLTAQDSGQPAGVSDYVTLPRQLGSYVTVPEGMMGEVTAEELWKRDLEDLSKDIRGMHMFTTNSQEIRYYNKAKTLVDNGKKIFANNPQMLAAIAPLNGELVRWRNDRAWALTQQQGTANDKSIGKIQERMVNAINYARTAMGIAAIPSGSILPEMNIPKGQLPNLPGATGTPEPTPPAVPIAPTPAEKALAPQSWFQKNKTLVAGAALLATLLGGYVWYRQRS